MHHSGTWMGRCLAGEIVPGDMEKEIDDAIEEWHEGVSDLPLHTFLGMTWDEYASWVELRRSAAEIVAARKGEG